jgi:hypothetical protein
MNPDIVMREMSMKFNLALLACTKDTTFYIHFCDTEYFSVLAEADYLVPIVLCRLIINYYATNDCQIIICIV